MTLGIKCQHNLIRIHGQEIVLLRNSSETASKVDVGWWKPKTSIEEMAPRDREESGGSSQLKKPLLFLPKSLEVYSGPPLFMGRGPYRLWGV